MIGTFPRFAGGLSNGRSGQERTFGFCSNWTVERPRRGRLVPVSIQAERLDKLTFDRAHGRVGSRRDTDPSEFQHPRWLPIIHASALALQFERGAGDQH